MFRQFGIPLLAIVGILFSLFMIFWSRRKPPIAPILYAPAESPYRHYVMGEGIVKSFNENIEIGTSFPDLIWEVFVQSGDVVKKGQPLFRLDTRQQEANLLVAEHELRLAATVYENKKIQFQYYENIQDKSAVSKQVYTHALYDMRQAREQVDVAHAQVNRIKTIIERALIRAPIDGTVLQSNARIGEFANVNPFDRLPLLVLGNTQRYHMHVTVAQEDAWRIEKGASATAFIRGNSAIEIPLTFDYIEPYMTPKQILTGIDFERIDTRVLEVVYAFDAHEMPIYVGQLLDVYIQAQPSRVS